MTQPTEEQLLILNSIIYTDGFATQTIREDKPVSVYTWANKFDINSIDNENKPAEISQSEFENIINTIKSNPDVYKKMKIRNIDNTQKANESGSQRVTNATISYNGDTIIVYKGTAGDMEWRDNGEGAYSSVTDTKQQIKALEYFDKSVEKYGQGNIYVTGHSKGGNKAQYVTVQRGNQIKATYSFDGQGFNNAFLAKYRDEIKRYSQKITNISNENDFVNILLNPIARNRIYIKSTTSWGIMDGSSGSFFAGGVHKFGAWHSPYSMTTMDANGNLILNETVPQSELMQQVQGLFAHYATYMNEEDWRYLCYTLMTVMANGAVNYGDDYSEMPEGFSDRLMALTKGYMEKTKGINALDVAGFMADLLGGHVISIPGLIGTIGVAGSYAMIEGEAYSSFPRDFTQATKDSMMSILKEIEEKPWWDVTQWDAYHHVSHLLGGMDFPTNSRELDDYYKKMIDKDDMSAEQIHQIFDKVYEAEASFAKEMAEIGIKVKSINKQLTDINNGFK